MGSRKSSSTLVALVKASPGHTRLDNVWELGLDMVTFNPIIVGEKIEGLYVPFNGDGV